MNNYKILLPLSIILLLTACGGGGGSSNNSSGSASTSNTGVFLDSPIVNIGYRTETLEGVTNSKGEYEYLPGETVTFFIGDLEFPPVTASGIVTPLDIAGTNDTNDVEVVNMVRLLQTLDGDGNPDNGISISDGAKSAATQVDFTLDVDSFAASTAVTELIANGGQEVTVTELVSVSDALDHFKGELTANNIAHATIEGVWTFEGEDVLFIFLPDSRYFAIQSAEENGFIGFERGIYSTSEGDLTFTTLQNNDGEALFCHSPSSTCPEGAWGYSLSGDALTLEPADILPGETKPTLDRANFSQDTIQGVWTFADEDVLFIFLADNRYFAIQSAEENGFIGFERGVYSTSEGELTFTTLQNNDGEALFCHSPSSTCPEESWGYSLSGDTLTLEPADLLPGETKPTLDRRL